MDYNYLKTLPKDILIKLITELETSFSTVYILNRCFVNSRNMEVRKEMMGVYLSFEKAIEAIELETIDQDDTMNYSYRRKILSQELRNLCSQNLFGYGVCGLGYKYSISKSTIGQTKNKK